MQLKNIIRYIFRFLLLQLSVTISNIWFFDNFLFISVQHKFNIYLNLIEDRDRFFGFIPTSWITVDGVIAFVIFIFLLLLYSTKFYTYVNELDFSYENKYFDDYLLLYLTWNSYIFTTLYIFRIDGLFRSNLIIFTFLTPTLLFLFRNSEILSNLLGRSVSNENYISFNLEDNSNFNNLRILAFRNEKLAIKCTEKELSKRVVDEVDKLNKIINVNLIVLYIESLNKLSKNLENYLINLNKKVLIISSKEINFSKNFIYRFKNINNKSIYYFNNDIQYGSKYIIKRLIDVSFSIIIIFFLLPFLLIISVLILFNDSRPIFIKQLRVGLHGKPFKMYKFRTMLNNSHELRSDLQNQNKKTGPLFKLDDDPRIISNLNFLRKFSLDELPQLINVLKGEMSLVGPRPLFFEDNNYFDSNYMRRLNVIPGMTGLLQINDRNTDDFNVWYKHDIEYIENWSLYLDLKILFKTIKYVLNQKDVGL